MPLDGETLAIMPRNYRRLERITGSLRGVTILALSSALVDTNKAAPPRPFYCQPLSIISSLSWLIAQHPGRFSALFLALDPNFSLLIFSPTPYWGNPFVRAETPPLG
jgi:hypothetical protein